jgi:uncharacterized membrane protein YdbT with pleckstrin-like domain
MKNNQEYIWRERKRIKFFALPISFTTYRLTGEKLLVNRGFFTTHFDEVRLYRILDLSMTQTLCQKIFNIGTISVSSSDKSMKSFELINVKNPEKVKDMLSDMVEEERIKKRVFNREYMSSDIDDDDNEEQ